MASVEDLLLYQAQLDGEARGENNLETAAVGALLGSASGLETQRRLIESVEKLTKTSKDARPTGTTISQAIKDKIPRVKGGLAGAALGGVLAAIGKQLLQRESLAAELYAKRIAGEPMSAAEIAATEKLIAQTVSRTPSA